MNETPTIVGLGEALFDIFPERRILGGAPLNFAVHAHQLARAAGGQGIVASRVGDDPLGHELLEDVTSRDMTVDFIQIDGERPTGRVNVTLEGREPHFEIIQDVAWDALEFDAPLERLAASCDAVCFGSLAQRSKASRAAIHGFLGTATRAIKLYDVNLRQHYYSREVIEQSCRSATVVKLNEDELPVVARELQMGESAGDHGSVDRWARTLRERFDLQMVALTHGAQGTVLYAPGERLEQAPVQFPLQPNADSVGAGDACTAGLIVGLLRNWPLDRTLALANRAGAYVASVPGATPLLPRELFPELESRL